MAALLINQCDYPARRQWGCWIMKMLVRTDMNHFAIKGGET